jgi:hypothetical protein
MLRILLAPVFIALFFNGQPVRGVPVVQKPSPTVKKSPSASERATASRFFRTWLRKKDVTAALGFVHPDLYLDMDQFRGPYFGDAERSIEERQRLLQRIFADTASKTDGSDLHQLFKFEDLEKPIRETRTEKARKEGIRLMNQPLRDGFVLLEINPELAMKAPRGDVDWASLMKTFPSRRYLVTFVVIKLRNEDKTSDFPFMLLWAKTPRGWQIIRFHLFGV